VCPFWRRTGESVVLGHVVIEKKFNPMNSTIFVLFDKYWDQLGLKDSSRDFQLNCVISYLFYLHLILHASGEMSLFGFGN
jgi:hypothetical protein